MTDASAIVTAALASLAPYVGGGGLLIALGHAGVAIAKKALPVLADAKKTAAETAKTDAETRKTLAEAKAMEVQADTAAVQRGLADAETIASALDEMREMRAEYAALRQRLDDCEAKHDASDDEIARLRAEVERLRTAMRAKGITPADFPAAPKE